MAYYILSLCGLCPLPKTVDVEQNEVTTAVPQPAKLGNNISSSGSRSSSALIVACSGNLWQAQHSIQVALTLFLIMLNRL